LGGKTLGEEGTVKALQRWDVTNGHRSGETSAFELKMRGDKIKDLMTEKTWEHEGAAVLKKKKNVRGQASYRY